MSEANNIETIKAFIEAWTRLDADEIVSFFTDDGVYHNMPIEPVQGKDALKVFIQRFIADWTSTEWDLLNIAASGNIVMAERLDRTMVGETKVDLPCCGVFEMSNGKIAVWRDYFDMATYTRPLTG
ncbi:limonene-1,2-epoxide hydrolase family protein [Henriciella mobilis]|uniref:Limonene-1,2-epoxide hydrolase n=1 Tax=Henriciella mobilis TaxID=2305467 RepID=A0A399RDL9_9PROT|nr:limonene-1,2-epoxide hydrolase family protein [Henriciella mobilis]RIJ28581.1 limonene-1,2-epoxide hydrolase [Henriciella mobilis]